MAITSESQLIDVATISNGCATIRAAVKDYTDCANKVKQAHDTCTASALSVEKTTMQPTLEDLRASIAGIEGQVDALLTELENAVNQIYVTQSQELAEYKAAQQAANNQ